MFLDWLFSKIDEDSDDMRYQNGAESLPSSYDEYENRDPLARSYGLAVDSNPALVETFDGEFYRNTSPYAMAVRIEVDPPETK